MENFEENFELFYEGGFFGLENRERFLCF